MGEPRFDSEGERIHSIPWIKLDFYDDGLQVDYFNTWVRLYSDDPQFNHVDWMNPEGRCVKLLLPDEALTKMVELGFRQTLEIIPSKEVEEWMIAMIMFDVDVNEITVPQEWEHGV